MILLFFFKILPVDSIVLRVDMMNSGLFFSVRIGELGLKLLLIFQPDFKKPWKTPSLGSRHN